MRALGIEIRLAVPRSPVFSSLITLASTLYLKHVAERFCRCVQFFWNTKFNTKTSSLISFAEVGFNEERVLCIIKCPYSIIIKTENIDEFAVNFPKLEFTERTWCYAGESLGNGGRNSATAKLSASLLRDIQSCKAFPWEEAKWGWPDCEGR